MLYVYAEQHLVTVRAIGKTLQYMIPKMKMTITSNNEDEYLNGPFGTVNKIKLYKNIYKGQTLIVLLLRTP